MILHCSLRENHVAVVLHCTISREDSAGKHSVSPSRETDDTDIADDILSVLCIAAVESWFSFNFGCLVHILKSEDFYFNSTLFYQINGQRLQYCHYHLLVYPIFFSPLFKQFRTLLWYKLFHILVATSSAACKSSSSCCANVLENMSDRCS